MRSPIDGADVVTRQADAQAEARALLTPSLDMSSLDVLDESTEPESTPPASERGDHVRRRKRVPRAWSAANEGRVEDLRVALVQRSTGLATAGPTARLGGSSSNHGPGPTRTLNWCNGEGVTPLHAACLHGHADCVQLLLDAHAALDPRQKGGATPLIVATRQGHASCVARLLGAGADIARRDETGTALDNVRAASVWVVGSDGGGGGSGNGGGGGLQARLAECLSILEAAEQRQDEEQAVLLQQRQREAAALAHAAEAFLEGPNLVRVALDRPGLQPSAPRRISSPRRSLSMAWRERDGPALELAARDDLLHASCMAMATHGFEAGHVAPPALERWVGSAAGRERLAQLAEEIPPLAEVGTGRELALVIRVLQMHLREAAQPAAGGALGADQLVPLLEPLVVAASPRDAWSLHARMQTISAQVLLTCFPAMAVLATATLTVATPTVATLTVVVLTMAGALREAGPRLCGRRLGGGLPGGRDAGLGALAQGPARGALLARPLPPAATRAAPLLHLPRGARAPSRRPTYYGHTYCGHTCAGRLAMAVLTRCVPSRCLLSSRASSHTSPRRRPKNGPRQGRAPPLMQARWRDTLLSSARARSSPPPTFSLRTTTPTG